MNIQTVNVLDFKALTYEKLKPTKYNHFQKGNTFRNSIGHTDSPECLCQNSEESPLHYFLECFLYLPGRQALFGLFEHYIQNFPNLSKKGNWKLSCKVLTMIKKIFTSQMCPLQ